jgi:eukaryotic-like serine/threonine-protein kinase
VEPAEASSAPAPDGAPKGAAPDGEEIAPDRHVLAPLGGGSRYEVVLVWDEHRFALLVAKMLRPELVADLRALRELCREAELLARLAHPSLVRGFGAVTEGPRPHVLLEHVEGPTLHRLVARSGPLAVEQLVPLALHVAAALGYLHAEDVVHLDVKPANVVMSAPPKLVDLSIARPVASAARLRAAIGTDAFMAPEACAPGRTGAAVGPPADVWGLGATLHFALTRRPPFPRSPEARHAPDPAVRFPQLAGAPLPLPKETPAPLAALVAATLARDPAERPTARDVALALEPLVEETVGRGDRRRRR